MFGWDSIHLRECQPEKRTQTHFSIPQGLRTAITWDLDKIPGQGDRKPELPEIWILPLPGMRVQNGYEAQRGSERLKKEKMFTFLGCYYEL